ncbi:MAG: dockerin type I domain-containing protein [Pirellulales bacterium]
MRCSVACLVGLAAVGIGQANAAVFYRATDLGTLGGTWSAAYGINASGQVVGESRIPGDRDSHAFLYDGSTMSDLGTIMGSSRAYAINAGGQIVGETGIETEVGIVNAAFLYSGGTMTYLTNHSFTTARDINDSGQVVGAIGRSDVSAFLYSGSTLTLLDWGPFSDARGINSSGQVAGVARFGWDGEPHAFRYSGSTVTDLGTLGGIRSFATAINDRGDVVGSSSTADGSGHAFLYYGSWMVDLGTLGQPMSSANAINNLGEVVGWVGDYDVNARRAFLYTNGRMTDLNDLIIPVHPWRITEATGINDAGQIAAIGRDAFGVQHAFLLAPIVPEPGDVDKNGRVDIFDVAVLQRHYGMTSGATWAKGDFDGNGTVDIQDVAMMQVNYGHGVASSPTPVPEPSSLVLAAMGVLGIVIGWWRKRAA